MMMVGNYCKDSNMKTQNKINIIIRIFLATLPIGIFVFLLNTKFVRWGNFIVEKDFTEKYHPFISTLRPNERMEQNNNGNGHYATMIGEPVYFDIEVPRDFNNVELAIEYSMSSGNSSQDFKIGILVDKNNWQYKLLPIENSQIEELLTDWNYIDENGRILLQRSNKYDYIDDFLNNLPNISEIAMYHYNLKNNFLIPDYQPSKEMSHFNVKLKGYHQFYTYLNNEALNFSFNFELENKNGRAEEEKYGMINVYFNNGLIESIEIYKNDELLREVVVYMEKLPEGVYKMELKIPDDIFVKSIVSAQNFLTFINKMNVAVGNNLDDKKLKLYTDSPELVFATSNGNALQKIKVQNKILEIDDLYKQFTINEYKCDEFEYLGAKYCLSEIEMAKPGMSIYGTGLFSFSENAFINPKIKLLENFLDLEKINYVIAEYKQPQNINGWKKNTVFFDIAGLDMEERKYKFILSARGLDDGNEIAINRIRAVFSD